MFGCSSVSFRTIKERKNTFVSYHLFTMCKFQLITTNKNMKNDKLPRMFTTKTQIRLYRRTIGCLSLSSQQTVSGHYRPASETALKCCFAGWPIVARLKKPLFTKTLTRLHNLMPVFFQPAHGVGPLSACQRNAIQMSFRWRADSGLCSKKDSDQTAKLNRLI